MEDLKIVVSLGYFRLFADAKNHLELFTILLLGSF